MTKTVELKSCPFCGAAAKLRYTRSGEDSMATWVECPDCGASTDATDDAYSDPKTAAALWNRRPVAVEPGKADDWQDDPSADERWNAGCDFAMTHLCSVLGVDPKAVTWDAATETLDGDVEAVIGNILSARFGDDWRSSPSVGGAEGWRDIETAPKDGTWFLGWRPSHYPECRVDVWHWDKRANFWLNAADSNIDEYPTHWRPMLDGPAAPTPSSPGGRA